MKTQEVTDVDSDSSSMDAEDTAHVAGFFDGIGKVTVRVVKDTDYRLDFTLRPLLRITRTDVDDPMLGKLAAYCEEQGVRYTMMEKDGKVEWNVTYPESIKRFFDPLMDYLVSTYLEAELVLSQILPGIEEGQHTSKEGFLELMGMVDELRGNSGGGREIKYTQEYFANKWSDSE